jgi:hypothetical protein
MYGIDGQSLLMRDIQRLYYHDKELWSKEKSGKVAEHKYFILKEEYQSKGIGKQVHAKELDTYKKNGFDEIQLEAAWDGLVVWKRLFFNFKSKRDEDLIKIAIQRYLVEVKGLANSEIKSIIKSNPFSISSNYLKDNKIDFKEWVYEVKLIQTLVKLYKELS